jgi:hypothetical protein
MIKKYSAGIMTSIKAMVNSDDVHACGLSRLLLATTSASTTQKYNVWAIRKACHKRYSYMVYGSEPYLINKHEYRMELFSGTDCL